MLLGLTNPFSEVGKMKFTEGVADDGRETINGEVMFSAEEGMISSGVVLVDDVNVNLEAADSIVCKGVGTV